MVKRFGFRFGVVFAAILVLPFPLDLIPKTDFLVEKYGNAWDALGHRFADLLGIAAPPTQPTGSGDTTIAYVIMLLSVLIAIAIAAVWASFDRKDHPRLAAAVRIALRYWLGYAMLQYGWSKVWKTQFPYPSALSLEQPVGAMSPMGLLWTFMGHSGPYNFFAGSMECLGGILLLFRRTTLAGALVLVPVLTNVVILNFCYDVPVKLYSTTLLLIAIALAWRDLPRLIAVVLGHNAPPAEIDRLVLTRRSRRLLIGGKVVMLALIAHVGYQQITADNEDRTLDIDGRYDVVEMQGLKWERAAIGYHVLQVYMGAQSTMFQLDEPAPHTLTITSRLGEQSLSYVHAGNTIVLDGTWMEKPFHAVLRERPPTLLESRGFHLINEFPFNR